MTQFLATESFITQMKLAWKPESNIILKLIACENYSLGNRYFKHRKPVACKENTNWNYLRACQNQTEHYSWDTTEFPNKRSKTTNAISWKIAVINILKLLENCSRDCVLKSEFPSNTIHGSFDFFSERDCERVLLSFSGTKWNGTLGIGYGGKCVCAVLHGMAVMH